MTNKLPTLSPVGAGLVIFAAGAESEPAPGQRAGQRGGAEEAPVPARAELGRAGHVHARHGDHAHRGDPPSPLRREAVRPRAAHLGGLPWRQDLVRRLLEGTEKRGERR
eukprot:1194555-Prorocentrum_minimum.AAC.2